MEFEASHPPIEQSRSVNPQESTNRAASLHMATLPLLPVFVLAFLLAPPVRASPDVTVVSTLCNSAAYTGGDPFAISLAYILADLLKAAPDRRGHDYYNISPYPNAFAYGHAACKANLTASDCATCLRYAEGQMNSTCGMRIGARSVLVDCTTRYEQYPFRN